MSKFFPTSARHSKTQEFLELRQGTMKVLEYKAKFTELACFTDDYVVVAKVRKFEDGLKLSIRGKFMGLLLQDMDLMVRKTMPTCHTQIPGPTRMADPNRVRARDYILGLFTYFFFFRAQLIPVGIQIISVITKIIYIHKRTTTGVVSIHIYTHILSPIYLYIYKNNFTFQLHIQSAEPTVMNPY